MQEPVANNLLTAADLAQQEPGSTVVMPRGSVITPGAYDYAREHSITIRIDSEACPEEIGSRVVKVVLDEFQRSAGRKPTRDEAIALVEAVVKRMLAGED